MNPRRLTLRASLDQLVEDFAGAVLQALRHASFKELGELENAKVNRTVEAPAPLRPTDLSAPPFPPADVPAPPRPPPVLARLSPRERDIFLRALHGASNARIGLDLGISVKTVQTHRAKLNKKLGLRSGMDLVRFGATHGLLRPAAHDHGADVGELLDASSQVFNLAEIERRTIAAALRATDGNRSRAAILLGIPRSSLYNKLPQPEASPQGAEPDDGDPSVAITEPQAMLGLLEPAANEARRPAAAPRPTAQPAPQRIELRPIARPGEEVLRASTGGVVLRRRRTPASPAAAE